MDSFLTPSGFIDPYCSIHKVLYSCDMNMTDKDGAQLEKTRELCKNENCDIAPKTVFDTSACPGGVISVMR